VYIYLPSYVHWFVQPTGSFYSAYIYIYVYKFLTSCECMYMDPTCMQLFERAFHCMMSMGLLKIDIVGSIAYIYTCICRIWSILFLYTVHADQPQGLVKANPVISKGNWRLPWLTSRSWRIPRSEQMLLVLLAPFAVHLIWILGLHIAHIICPIYTYI
jgi:hypothetical protein